MIVPIFWAEGREQRRIHGRKVTVRRFGWSDISQSDAQASADARVAEAMGRMERGETIQRRELKRGYNGSEGVPIREEVVARQGEAVITRNTYGALCLNTPNVLFADVDFRAPPGGCVAWFASLVVGVTCGATVCLGIDARFAMFGFLAFVPCLILLLVLRNLLHWLAGGAEGVARKQIQRFVDDHLDWHVRLYRTPAGLRVLAVHRTFSAHDPSVLQFFGAIGADRLYVQMCLKQNCFRARVSPKPWRIGMQERLVPQTVWPCAKELLPQRAKWVRQYDQLARDYASCRFVEALGSGATDSQALAVQRWHDELCQAHVNLPIA